MSTQEMVGLMESYVRTQWQEVLEEHREELAEAFLEIEDAAYGIYLDKLMEPLFEEMESVGFITLGDLKESDFVIGKSFIFRNSIEKWGTEDNRSRVFWIVVEDRARQLRGTLIFDFYHSHLEFEVPAAPKFSVIEEISRKEIMAAIERMKVGSFTDAES